MSDIKRGEIYWVNLDPTVGSEIKKLRPAIVVSNNVGNKHSSLVTILPITSTADSPYPFEVLVAKNVGGLKKASLVKANQIRTVDKKRINGMALGSVLPTDIMEKIDQAIKVHLSL